jgi:hypothetical protein
MAMQAVAAVEERVATMVTIHNKVAVEQVVQRVMVLFIFGLNKKLSPQVTN